MRLFTLLRNKIKGVCDIHYEPGTIYNININDIKIPEDFEKTPPRKAKMDRKRRYYIEQTDNLYIKTCWSFSNNRKAYIYSKACYEYKRRLHNAICFGEYKAFEDYCGIDLSEIDSYEDLNERRKAARRAILKALKPYSFKEPINSNTHIPKEIYDAILSGNKDWRNLQSMETTKQGKGLVSIISSENLERTKNGKSIERLQNLQSMEASKQGKCIKSLVQQENLDRTKQGKNVENMLCLTNLERTKNSKNVESLAQQENLLRSKNITASNISITSKSYDEIDLPDPNETIILCDPPYRDTQGYQIEFDNDKFEQWCIDKSREGYEVFVCEYNIKNPAFEEVWSKEE